MSNVPAGHECGACGGRVESLVVDWADDEGRQVVAEKVPMYCAACSTSLKGRRTLVDPDSQLEVAVEGVVGVRRVAVRVTSHTATEHVKNRLGIPRNRGGSKRNIAQHEGRWRCVSGTSCDEGKDPWIV